MIAVIECSILLFSRQRAMDTIYKLNGSVQALGKDTQARVHSASTGIMSELEKVQVSISHGEFFQFDRH